MARIEVRLPDRRQRHFKCHGAGCAHGQGAVGRDQAELRADGRAGRGHDFGSIDRAEEDFNARQVAEARVEADRILAAVDKAKQNDAYLDLTDEERGDITKALNELLVVYHSDDHLLIRAKIDQLNNVT